MESRRKPVAIGSERRRGRKDPSAEVYLAAMRCFPVVMIWSHWAAVDNNMLEKVIDGDCHDFRSTAYDHLVQPSSMTMVVSDIFAAGLWSASE